MHESSTTGGEHIRPRCCNGNSRSIEGKARIWGTELLVYNQLVIKFR